MIDNNSQRAPKPVAGQKRARKTIYDELADNVAEQAQPELSADKEKSVYEQNIELLISQGKNGENLAGWYLRVIEKYPELKEVLILQRPEGTIGATTISKFSKNNQSGRHEIVIDLTPGSEDRYMEDFKHRQESLRLIEKRLRMLEKPIGAKTFQLWILLHELGHALDYIHTNLLGDKKIKARGEEMRTLPIGMARIKDLREPEFEADLLKKYPNIFAELSEKYKIIITDFEDGIINSFDDLIRLQEREYKSLPSEVYADDFATSILLSTKFDPNNTA
ncbi:MAG: hypothetical protein NTY56_01675 [Patescibacteria group bacterium]|nr:hypothetical protein [Patescibacteria group bacterium]